MSNTNQKLNTCYNNTFPTNNWVYTIYVQALLNSKTILDRAHVLKKMKIYQKAITPHNFDCRSLQWTKSAARKAKGNEGTHFPTS